MLTIIIDHLMMNLGVILGIIFIATLSRQSRSTASAFAWLLLIVFVPYVGGPLYLLLGGRKLKTIAQNKQKIYQTECQTAAVHDNAIERILCVYSVPPTTEANEMHLLSNGEEAYACIMQLIDNAKTSIEIQTFLLGKGTVGHAILQRLTCKAKEGVQVRFLLDGLSAFFYRKKYIKALRKAGGQVEYFLPLRLRIFRSRINLRNHRKIFIVDGKTAILGGMNLANEYMGPQPSAARWCDIAVRVTGEVVNHARHLFYSDWNFAGTEQIQVSCQTISPVAEVAPMQLVASGPDVIGEPFYDALLIGIFNAQHHITIVTPYFVPDLSLMKALTLASVRGVKVTVIVPQHSNHPLPDFARSIHLRQLLSVGADILFFTPTMMHAKVVTIDQSLASIGSSNVDMRSLFLNFEDSLFFYGEKEIAKVNDWITHIKPFCVTHFASKHPTRLRLWAENIALLLAPLL